MTHEPNEPAESTELKQNKQLIEFSEYILDLLNSSSGKKTMSAELMQVPEVAAVCRQIKEVREFSSSLQKGRLDHSSNGRGYLVSVFKALQSDLKHVTWQMKNVAAGGYEERVYFLGEFSESFNIMLAHLSTTMEEIHNLTEKYKELSTRDPLTGCHNRNALTRVCQSILLRAAKDQQDSTLLLIDLDFFKAVNDTYGHPVGDSVLCTLVDNIYKSLRFEDVCCRYGGEEFLVIIPGVSLDIGISIAERIRKNIEVSYVVCQDVRVRVTVSIGVAGLSATDIFLNTEAALTSGIGVADKNLYTAKQNGRNQVCSD